MSKDVLVKQAFAYDAFGRIVPMASTQGRDSATAPVRGERLAGIAGGALGALTGIAGKHRSLGSLANAMMFGAQQGKSAGQRLRRFASTEGERARAQRRQDIDRAYERLVASGQITPPRGPIGIRKPQLRSSKVQQINAPVVSPRPRSKPMIPFGGGPAIPGTPRPRPFGAGPPPRVPVSHRIPAEAGVIGPKFQLNPPPSKVAVEEPLLLGPGDWTEEEIRDDPRTDTSKIAVKPERGVSTEGLPKGSLGEFAIPVGERVRVERPAPSPITASRGPSKEVRVMSRQGIDPWAGSGISSSWGQNDVSVYAPSASSELYSDQEASDAALRANAAAATEKLMQTPPPPPLQTTGGANAELLAGENAATFAETPVTDDKRGDGGPTVEQAGQQMTEVAVKKPFEFARQGGFGNVDLSQAAKDAEELNPLPIQSSIDRLPAVGIRKARTRRVLIV
tara:strand:+ start:6594 stop:7946 length:1353 start_codon:yes stop_codon:yes gene_type:complete